MTDTVDLGGGGPDGLGMVVLVLQIVAGDWENGYDGVLKNGGGLLFCVESKGYQVLTK